MDVNILYNVEHEHPLGLLIATYSYLTGLSAGSFILSTLAYGFGIEKYKPVGKVGVVLATVLLILALGKARILWNTAIMPPIFLISAMVSGIAMMILVVVIKGYFFSHERKVDTGLCFDLAKMLAWAIIVDLAFIATDVLVLLTSHTEAYLAAIMLLKGGMSHLFIGVEVILKSIVPLFFLLFPLTKDKLGFVILSSILVMIGIFTMRYVMVVGGLGLLPWMSPWRILSRASALKQGGLSVSRTTGCFRKGIPSTCLQCYSRCGIIGYNEYGRIVKIGGNPEHPNSRGRLCARGQAGINYVYDPDRVLYPLKRDGRRGANNWKRISCEEAYREVTERLVEVKEGDRPEEFIFQSSRDITNGDFTDRFSNAFGTPMALNHASLGGLNKETALKAAMGAEVDINDVGHSHYIVNFGANPYETHFLYVPLVQRITDSRINLGSKLVTFDVRLSQTAGKSDEWFPIKPGTDATVALAMAKIIMEEGLHDKQFLEDWTNYPLSSPSIPSSMRPTSSPI